MDGPTPAEAANSTGGELLRDGKPQEARPWFEQAIRLAPAWAKPRYNLGLAYLTLGDYARGFELHETRRFIRGLGFPDLGLPCPEWQGEDLAGRTLTVVGEQGFGDQIMLARFLPRLRELGAIPRYLCQAEVAPVLPDALTVLSRDEPADYWVAAFSLPHRLSVLADRVPPPHCIAAPPTPGGGVGVVGSGNPRFPFDADRSLFGADLERLCALGRDLSPAATGVSDFLETARIVAGLDLVITTDTAMAHLAGSMGKPTWILLGERSVDWRWGRAGASTAWYPTARLFRKGAGGWPALLDDVKRALSLFKAPAGAASPVS